MPAHRQGALRVKVDLGPHVATRREIAGHFHDDPHFHPYTEERRDATFNNLDPAWLSFALDLGTGLTETLVLYVLSKMLTLAKSVRRPVSRPAPLELTIRLGDDQAPIAVPVAADAAELRELARRILASTES